MTTSGLGSFLADIARQPTLRIRLMIYSVLGLSSVGAVLISAGLSERIVVSLFLAAVLPFHYALYFWSKRTKYSPELAKVVEALQQSELVSQRLGVFPGVAQQAIAAISIPPSEFLVRMLDQVGHVPLEARPRDLHTLDVLEVSLKKSAQSVLGEAQRRSSVPSSLEPRIGEVAPYSGIPQLAALHA